MGHLKPNYKKIYTDLLTIKFPDKKEQCIPFLNKKDLSELDIIKLNKMIFGNEVLENTAAKNHRSYSKLAIIEILDYQKENKLNNSQTAKYYGLSRNTIAKWKKIFIV